jgi:hypothetical protein
MKENMKNLNGRFTKLLAPEGWKWVRKPTADRAGIIRVESDSVQNRQDYAAHITILATFAKENDLGVEPFGHLAVMFTDEGRRYNVWTKFRMSAVRKKTRLHNLAPFECRNCGRKTTAGQSHCGFCGERLVCVECGVFGITLHLKGALCSRCCGTCEYKSCNAPTTPHAKLCAVHDPKEPCFHCGVSTSTSKLKNQKIEGVGTRKLCPSCLTLVCPECGGFGSRVVTVVGKKMCLSCKDALSDKEVERCPGTPEVDIPRSGSLVIPGLPERPSRTITVEIEYDSDHASWVAGYFFRKGFTSSASIANYSATGEARTAYPCLLKSDGSVTGGELVAFMFNLDDEKHATILLDLLDTCNKLKQAKKIRFSVNAGGHIHQDAHNISVADGFALVTVFNYLEDTLHRIAGAGDDGHQWTHRALHGNNHGSHAVLKGPFGSKRAFGAKMREFSRAALNIQHFVNAMANCSCGAREYEAWNECTCVLPKNTVEWRVFNPTISPRVLHGWVAMIQSISAYATAIEINEADFPVFEFVRQKVEHMLADAKGKWAKKSEERLAWMFTHLPMTADEKDSLLYSIKKSELKHLGVAYLDSLLAMQARVAFDLKPEARNPNRREIIIGGGGKLKKNEVVYENEAARLGASHTRGALTTSLARYQDALLGYRRFSLAHTPSRTGWIVTDTDTGRRFKVSRITAEQLVHVSAFYNYLVDRAVNAPRERR